MTEEAFVLDVETVITELAMMELLEVEGKVATE